MAVSKTTNSKEPDLSMDIIEDDDNHSETTIPSGKPIEEFEAELVEIFIRYEITINQRNANRGPELRHVAVLKAIYDSFSEEEVQLINNRNKRIQLPTYKKWADPNITINISTHIPFQARTETNQSDTMSSTASVPPSHSPSSGMIG
jgi:hypothetical protein